MSDKKASDTKLAIKNTIVDTRPWPEKFGDFLDGGEGVFMVGLILAGAILFVPSMAEIFFVAGLIFLYIVKKRKYFLPIRMPVSFQAIDEMDIKPDGKNFHKARGVFYFGNEMKSNKELWFAADDVKTHMVIFGTTGAGKALRDNEWVLTEHSWKRNKDLQKGDFVQTPNNGLSEILEIFPQGEKELAKLTFSDGRIIKTTWDHLWTFYDADKVTEHSEFIKPSESIYTKTSAINDHLKKGVTLALPYSLPKGHMDNFFNGNEFLDWWNKAIFNSKASVLPLIRASHLPLDLRIALWKQMMDIILVNPEKGKHFGNTSTFSLPESLANGLVILARSLGLWAGVEIGEQRILEDDQETYFEMAEAINFNAPFDYSGQIHKNESILNVVVKLNTPITLSSLKETKEKESCQCIQIEDPNGLFITRQHIVTHNTETLVSITYNALVQGSGFVYVDGKGDNGLWGKIMGCARQCGREGEVLVVNYMTGGEESFGLPSSKNSNTLNPLITGTSATLVELVSSLMDAAGSDPMWKSRAVALLQGIMPPLVYMRNRGEIILDVDIIRNYMNLPNIEKLTTRDDLPPSTLEGVKSYLDSLPGYVWGEEKQEADTMQQHGFLQMQFTRIFSMLADVYGFIFRTNLSEIVFHDIVVNRRILVVLLPALEKDPEGLSQLGKIILACLRQMMSTGLGSKLEGEHRTIIDAKPTAGPAPFLAILDEYGYYVTKGAAVMPAQARSLGVGMVFAGQDYAAFKKNDNASEAQSTVANCITKVFMKIVESEDTFGLFKSLVGEATVAKQRGLDKENGRLVAQNNVSYESVAKATLGDLSAQTEGLAHIIFKDLLVRTKMFFCNPPQLKEYRLNYFLRVEPIKPDDAHKFINSLKTLKNGLMDPEKAEQINGTLKVPDVILSLSEAFKIGQKEEKSSIELGVMSLVGQSIAQSMQMGQNKTNVENLRKKQTRLKEQFKAGRTNVFNQNERTPWDEDGKDGKEPRREPFGGRKRERIRFDESIKTEEEEKETETTETETETEETETEENTETTQSVEKHARDELRRRFEERQQQREKEEREERERAPRRNKVIEKLNEINEKIEPVEKKEKEVQVKSTEKYVQNLEQLTNYPDHKPSSKDANEVLDIIRSLEDELTTTSESTRY